MSHVHTEPTPFALHRDHSLAHAEPGVRPRPSTPVGGFLVPAQVSSRIRQYRPHLPSNQSESL